MREHADTSILSSVDLDYLQECFDRVLTTFGLARHTPEGDAVAKALITAFQGGVDDKDELVRLGSAAVPPQSLISPAA